MNHLTIEQCRKLKDLGFPQDSHEYYSLNKNNGEYDVSCYGWDTFAAEQGIGRQYETICSCPTLDELIEWITDNYLQDSIDPNSRFRLYLATNGWNIACESGSFRWEVVGESPLEACYTLAIAIKENK